MSLRQKFTRWYYGEFVNDPKNEVIMFGMTRPLSAQRWERVVRFVRKFWKI